MDYHQNARPIIHSREQTAHEAEHVVDLDSGAVVVAELAVHQSESRLEDTKVNIHAIEELVAVKGYLSGAILKRVKSYRVRSYIPEKRQKGKRRWQGKAEEQQAVYENRRRVRGGYGKRLLRRRGEH